MYADGFVLPLYRYRTHSMRVLRTTILAGRMRGRRVVHRDRRLRLGKTERRRERRRVEAAAHRRRAEARVEVEVICKGIEIGVKGDI